MKLTYFQFETHLAKTLQSIYVISGDEVILKQDTISQLRKKAKAAGFVDRIRITAETGYDWGHLHMLLNSSSLMAEKRLIEIDFRETTPSKLAGQILQEYAERPAADTILLIDIAKIDDKMARSAWYKALEKTGMVVAIWPINREQLPDWIIKRAQKYKLRMTTTAANVLADYVEGNLIAAAHTLEKIYLLKPEVEITPELIHSIITDESHYTVFDLVEQFVAGDTARTLHTLDVLKAEGTEPTFILWSIARELRLLTAMHEQLNQGIKYDELWQKHRIFSRRQSSLRRFLTKTTAKTCLQLLAAAAAIDPIIKGATPGNPWNALQLLCIRHSQS